MKSPVVLSIAALALSFLISCSNNSSNPTPSATDSLSGFLVSGRLEYDSSALGPHVDEQEAFAAFVATPGDSTFILVDTVIVNGARLVAEDSNIYGSLNALNMSSTCNWQVVGNATIPSFTFNYPVPYPSYSGTFPDTIVRSMGATFHLNFSGTDSVTISIANDSLGKAVTKAFSPTSTTQSFSAAELSHILPSSFFIYYDNIVTITLYKYSVQTFGGKKFLFGKEYVHSRFAHVL